MQLKRLLDSLETSADRDSIQIVVIDNDADASAKTVVAEHPLRPWYEIEPDPGIASARNRALDFFGEQFSAILFVDDDEWVDAKWYAEIVGYAGRSAAEVVQGPVVTILPEDVPKWIRRGQFFQRRTEVSGAKLKAAATNNVLLTRKAWVDSGCPRFDHSFSIGGGSDFDFFWGIQKAGASILYCAEAVVYEDVPPSRLSWKWIRRRYTRNGIAILRSHRKHSEPLAPFLMIRFAALTLGILRLLADVITGRGPRAAPLENIFKSLGVFAALIGYRINEYSR